MQNNIGSAREMYSERTGRKVTQEVAAVEIFKVGVSTYCRWEQGTGKLKGDVLCKIADVYGVSVDYLLRRTDNPTPYPPAGAVILNNASEAQLIIDYRQCTPRERNLIRETAGTMANNGLAKNNDVQGSAEAVG